MLVLHPGKRPWTLSRSTFPGTKAAHWLGDNLSTWDHYRKSIRGMLNFAALFAIPVVGSDVCGFARDTTEELCARWASLGAFSPLFRNHNRYDAKDQEFYRWATVADSARKAIAIRYRLLDYFYTHLRRNTVDGTPATLPMNFAYPRDMATWGLELQYFYGPGLLVAPMTEEGATSVDVYLPKDTFYDWHTHEPVCGKGERQTLSGYDTTEIPLLIRDGVIMPVRTSSANTTTALRGRDFELIVPLNANGTAIGELYLDDGESLEPAFSLIRFTYKDGNLTVEGTFDYEVPVKVSKVTVLGAGGDVCGGGGGLESEPRTVEVDVSLNEPGDVDLGEKQVFFYKSTSGDGWNVVARCCWEYSESEFHSKELS
jgi:alpha-glucosidase